MSRRKVDEQKTMRNIRMEQSLWNYLRDAAEDGGITISELVRKGSERYADELAKRPGWKRKVRAIQESGNGNDRKRNK